MELQFIPNVFSLRRQELCFRFLPGYTSSWRRRGQLPIKPFVAPCRLSLRPEGRVHPLLITKTIRYLKPACSPPTFQIKLNFQIDISPITEKNSKLEVKKGLIND